MLQFQKKLIKKVAVLLIMASTASSQTTVLTSKGDTNICFSLPRAKFLLKQSFKITELSNLNLVSETRRSFLDSAFQADEKSIKDESMMIKNDKEAFGLEEYKIQKLTEDLKSCNRATRRQKVYKWIAIIAGGTGVTFLGRDYIKNHFK